VFIGRFRVANETLCSVKSQGPPFNISKPCTRFDARIEYTNATATRPGYSMVIGYSYLFRIRVQVENPHVNMRITFHMANAHVTPIGYSIEPPPPSDYSATPVSGSGWAGYDFPPLTDRSTMEAVLEFIVTPHTPGFSQIAVNLTSPDSPICRGSVDLGNGIVREPPVRQRQLWIDVPTSALVWVTGGPGTLLASMDVAVRSVPTGLSAVVNVFAPSPLLASPTTFSGTTNFNQMLIY